MSLWWKGFGFGRKFRLENLSLHSNLEDRMKKKMEKIYSLFFHQKEHFVNENVCSLCFKTV